MSKDNKDQHKDSVTKEVTPEVNKETAKETTITEVKPTEVKKTKEQYKEELRRKIERRELQYNGRLVIDPKHKKPGKVTYIGNDDPGTKQYLESLGYTIVRDDAQVGSGSLQEPNNMGSAVHVELGITTKQPGILYEIDSELLAARRELEAEQNDAQLQSTVEAAQRPDQKK